MRPPDNRALAADVAQIQQIPAVETMLQVICRATGMGFAAVARVTADRWIACAVRDEIQFGLRPGGELEVATTICDEIRDNGEPVVIDHVAQDSAYCGHPTPTRYGFQSYISVPIRLPNGEFFGTLCAIDPKPNILNTPETRGMFQLFASLIAFHLDALRRVSVSEDALVLERGNAELREQFVAVLGHDLRSPLAAISSAASVLAKLPMDPRAKSAVPIIQRSAARMRELIENVTDFARGRLGGGLTVEREQTDQLASTLEQVIDELQQAVPNRLIESDIRLGRPVFCDRPRIAQLTSNLVANALIHGDAAGQVKLTALTQEASFELAVSNEGQPIAPAVMERLFQPFVRGQTDRSSVGLGLGLYIASEIARQHDGTLEVQSSPAQTRFTFRMPT